MNKKIISKILVVITISFILISCCEKETNPIDSSIPLFIKNKVVLATGINFDTKEAVVIDPDTGKNVLPCKQSGGYSEYFDKNLKPSDHAFEQNCDVQVKIADEKLNSILTSINKPLESIVVKNGKKINAKTIVIIETQYTGSDCTTIWVNGKQHQDCD